MTDPPTEPPNLDLERFFALSVDLLAVCSSRTGEWVRINAAFETTLGWRPEDLVGRPYLDLVHPDDRQRSAAAAVRVAAGEPLRDFEHRVRTAAGPYRWIAWRTRAMAEEQLMYCVGRDVTDTRAARQEIDVREERLRTIQSGAGIGVFDSDRLTDRTVVSAEYLDLYGLPRNEGPFRLRDWLERVHPEDREPIEAETRAAAADPDRARLDYAFRAIRADTGETRWIASRTRLIRDEEGRLVRSIGAQWDITAQRVADEAVRESEERLRTIVEEARDYAIFTTDANARIDDWTPGAEAVFGWTREEAIGQPFAVTFTPEDRAAGAPEAEFQKARADGLAPDVRWHQRKDGRRVFIDGSARARRSEDGAFRGVMKIGRDVTERRRVDEALAESESRLRTLIEGIPQLVWRADADGAWTWSSPQWSAYTGLSLERSLGDGWLHAVHPDDHAIAAEAWRTALETGALQADFRLCKAEDGAWRWFSTRATPVRDPSGGIVEWLGASTDIHDLHDLQERQKLLLAELQHRVRNMLAVVRSTAARTAESSEDLDSFLGHFDGRLTTLSRVQSVLTRTEDVAVDLEEMIWDEFQAVAAEPPRVEVEGPVVRLRQRAAETLALALHELTTNALKYGALSTERGRISVRWEVRPAEPAPRLELSWRESGVAALVAEPRRTGFGRTLIERALPYELGAQTALVFAGGGVRCDIRLPLTSNHAAATTGAGSTTTPLGTD